MDTKEEVFQYLQQKWFPSFPSRIQKFLINQRPYQHPVLLKAQQFQCHPAEYDDDYDDDEYISDPDVDSGPVPPSGSAATPGAPAEPLPSAGVAEGDVVPATLADAAATATTTTGVASTEVPLAEPATPADAKECNPEAPLPVTNAVVDAASQASPTSAPPLAIAEPVPSLPSSCALAQLGAPAADVADILATPSSPVPAPGTAAVAPSEVPHVVLLPCDYFKADETALDACLFRWKALDRIRCVAPAACAVCGVLQTD